MGLGRSGGGNVRFVMTMTIWRRKLAAAALVLIVLAGCSGGPAPSRAMATGSDDALSEAVFDVGYERIAEVYVDPVDMGRLTVDGLSGLTTIDQTLSAQRSGGMVQLVSAGRVIGEFEAPAPLDSQGWAEVTMAAIERGRAASPALRSANAAAVYDAVFSAITGDLDPYSRYVGPDRAQQERAYRDGYGGIGLLLEVGTDGRPHIQEVFPEGPAFRVGIAVGDMIVAVNGEPSADWSLEELGNRLRGPVNSRVQITLADAAGRSRTIELRRERVVPNVVSTRYKDGVAIIKISRFNAATAQHLAEAIDAARARLGPGAAGIILDLRGNPGGLLDQSVAVADLFISQGEIIHTRGRHPDSVQRFMARNGDEAAGLPLAVLIDGRSASGSEVVAAALQDSGRAVLVGASSFGKGSVQTVTRLPNDGELFLTWSRIFAPSGYTLHREGVMPTVCTSGSVDDPDQLIRRFRAGETGLPANLVNLRYAAQDDESALAQLRGACPWRAHNEENDVTVATKLLHDPVLFAQALAAAAPPAMAQRQP